MDTRPANNQRRVFLARVVGSVAIFVVFAIVAVSWVLTEDETLKWVLFLPLVASVVLLPREVRDESLDDARRTRLKLWLSSVRVVYLVIAVFVMLGLPELLT